jgi:SAM-dependent methyltransferase
VPDEQSHHDDWYSAEAERVFASPVLQAVRGRYLELLRRKLASFPDRPSLLSLGSGMGEHECAVADQCSRIIGVELSPVGVEKARARAADHPHVHFLAGDIRRLPDLVGDEQFDIIFAAATLHHLTHGDRGGVLRECAARLRPGGLFVSIDPSRRRLVRLLKPLARVKIASHHSPDEEELDPAELGRAATEAGLRPLGVEWVDFAAGPLGWVKPGLPRWVAKLVLYLDDALLHVPGLRSLASSFAFTASNVTR